MSKIGSMMTTLKGIYRFRMMVQSQKETVAMKAQFYVHAQCDNDSTVADRSHAYIEMEKAVKKLNAMESMR